MSGALLSQSQNSFRHPKYTSASPDIQGSILLAAPADLSSSHPAAPPFIAEVGPTPVHSPSSPRHACVKRGHKATSWREAAATAPAITSKAIGHHGRSDRPAATILG